MAIFHLCAKTMSRSSGHSATGGAAYRSASKIIDARKDLVHDYSRKRDVLKDDCRVILPGGKTADRGDLWNKVEQHHKRGDAVLAREVEISLPRELSRSQRLTLALDFANEIAEKFGVAADVCLHSSRTVSDRDLKMKPDQYHETDENGRRHNGNWHAHIMLSACHVSSDGTLGKKCVELDPIHCQRARIENMTDWGRARWNALANAALEKAKIEARIDHRSHVDRGILSEPSRHLGPAAFGYELRTGKLSSRRLQDAADAAERLAKAKEAGELERRAQSIRRSLFDLSFNISAAKAECEELREQQKIEDIKEHFERQRQSTEATRAVAEAVPESPPIIVHPSVPAEPIAPSALSKMFQNLKKFFVAPVAEPPKPAPSIKFGLGSKTEPRPEQVPEPVPVVPEPVVPVSAPTLLERPVPVPRPEPVTPVVPVPRPEPAAAVAAERKAETKAAAEPKAETKAEPVVPVVPVVPAAPSFSPPAPSAQNWPVVRSYLIEIRRFSADLVDELHEAGYVYADQFANAVFVLDSSRGVALQSTVDDSFYYLRGEKGAFTLLGSEQVAFTESCIDAISFRELGYEGEIVATCGLSAASVRELADQYRKIGYKIVAAYDDDAMSDAIGADLHIVPEGATTWNAELVLKDSHDVNDEAAAEPERPEPEPEPRPTMRMKR